MLVTYRTGLLSEASPLTMANSTRGAINFGELGRRLSTALSRATDSTSPPPARSGLLVVLDLHGVVVERIKREEKQQIAFARTQRNAWKKGKYHETWLRPHLQTFLDMVCARHNVAVWSSAQRRTIEELLGGVSGHFDIKPALKEKLDFIWDRPKCRPDEQKGGYATLKYMQDLWGDEGFGGRYSCKNTILLDDTISKFRDFPQSGVVVPEYCAERLQERYNSDDTLLWVLLYLEYVLEESGKLSEVDGEFDVAGSRANCMSLEDFTLAGRLAARKVVTTRRERKKLKSLAYVFLRDTGVGSATRWEVVPVVPKQVRSEEGSASVDGREGSPGSTEDIDMARLRVSNLQIAVSTRK